jgi:hypothetical protein
MQVEQERDDALQLLAEAEQRAQRAEQKVHENVENPAVEGQNQAYEDEVFSTLNFFFVDPSLPFNKLIWTGSKESTFCTPTVVGD